MYSKEFVKDLIQVIPRSGLAKVFSAYLKSELSSFPPDSPVEIAEQQSSEEPFVPHPPDEILDEMIVLSLQYRC
jgi:hypothetical protein